MSYIFLFSFSNRQFHLYVYSSHILLIELHALHFISGLADLASVSGFIKLTSSYDFVENWEKKRQSVSVIDAPLFMNIAFSHFRCRNRWFRADMLAFAVSVSIRFLHSDARTIYSLLFLFPLYNFLVIAFKNWKIWVCVSSVNGFESFLSISRNYLPPNLLFCESESPHADRRKSNVWLNFHIYKRKFDFLYLLKK